MIFFFQAEDGIRYLVRSRGLGDVYKRQDLRPLHFVSLMLYCKGRVGRLKTGADGAFTHMNTCLLYTSDAADERSSVDLGGRRIIKKKNKHTKTSRRDVTNKTSRTAYNVYRVIRREK